VGASLRAPGTSPSQHVARREVLERVAPRVRALPATQQEALELWATGHAVKEIAARMKRSELSVASLLRRAFENLREHPPGTRAGERPGKPE
jgi:DNA-directed RNA polymerase specialized sigma24 family protein